MKSFWFFFIALYAFTLTAQSTRKPQVDSFTEVALAIPGKAYVRQGNSYSVELEGPDDLLDEIEAVIEGGKLIIRHKDRWSMRYGRDYKNITAHVTLKQIKGLSVSGSGDMLVMTRVKTDRLKLKVSGSGSLKVEAEADEVSADVSGSGTMVVRGTLGNLDGNVSGSGRLEVNGSVANSAMFAISGSGDVTAQGKAGQVNARISGSGRVLASNLEARLCRAHISGSGEVEIHVSEELEAHISGSGDVRYTGNPTRINAHSSGSGKVRRLNS